MLFCEALSFAAKQLRIWEFFGSCRFGLLYFCADRHICNSAIEEHAVKTKPAHVGVVYLAGLDEIVADTGVKCPNHFGCLAFLILVN